MQNFFYHAPTKLIFGRDTHKKAGETVAPYAKKVLLHYGGQNIKKSGVYDAVTASLAASGVQYVELGGVRPNPRIELVREGVELCRRENVELVLAVGGGSVIDSAKAIAAGFCHTGDPWELFCGTRVKKALPIVTVLTIPAAGSEASNAFVISNGDQKRVSTSNQIRPLASIINPELFFTLPKSQALFGIADIMSHVFERYFTTTEHTDYTDALCEATLKTVMKNAPLVIENPCDYDAWFEIGFAGTFAHVNLVGLGRQQDWGCHNIEHELSALYDIAHGAGLAVLFPNWMKYIYKSRLGSFVQFAVNVFGVEAGRDLEGVALEGIERLRAFYTELGLPATLRDLGIGEDKLELMAKRATGVAYGRPETPIGEFNKMYRQDVLNIYKMSL
jgi:alcohol dehydrogenase YqhD (iron-dependent ADH family)